jgi:signal transduction histidine kinase
MSDSVSSNPAQEKSGSILDWLLSIWARLTSPSDTIIDPTVRFQARIVTITILILLVMVGLSIMAQSDLSPFTLLLLVVGYFISRTRYYIVSAFLVIANISFFVIMAFFDSPVLTREIIFMTIAWLTPSLILAGLIFSIRQMLLVTFMHFLLLFLLPVFIPELTFRKTIVGGGYILVVSAMILISMYLRTLLEREKRKELARLNEELEDRVFERTAQLEAFSYSVSHDLRAPLRAIRGFSDVLSSDFAQDLDDEGKTYLERIKVSSKKMDHLIDDLLMLSRLGRKDLDFESVNLGGLAESIFQELVGAEDEADQFHFTKEECPEVLADHHLVTILLTNLISNSIKFSRGSYPATIKFGCRQVQAQIEFFIEDNGIGFDPKYSDTVLRPFQRLHPDEEYEGTGVGLAIVNNIVQRHNGHLRIDSDPGRGTTVYFTL